MRNKMVVNQLLNRKIAKKNLTLIAKITSKAKMLLTQKIILKERMLIPRTMLRVNIANQNIIIILKNSVT